MVITRTARPGREAEFEAAIAEFFAAAADEPGTAGAYLLRPIRGANEREYGILRSFESERAKQAFYDSRLYREWSERVSPLVEGGPRKRELHGLEAFFRSDAGGAPPPAWKMAALTWIAVNPAVYIFANGVPKIFGALPPLVELLVVNAFVVATLTWAFMPLLTRIAAGWLVAAREEPASDV